MRIKFLIGFAVALCLLSFSKTEAQTLLQSDKIPDDLLIVLKRQGCCGGGIYSEMTITANGDISYQSRGGLPANSSISNLAYLNEKGKIPKFLKPKVPSEKLKALIGEFERIQFFRFGKDFPPQDEKETFSVTHQASETISIRINGQTKEVHNYLGDFTKRTRILRDLAERIRGAGVWNYENGEIPENFEVWYRLTDGTKIERDFKINGKGEIIERTFWKKTSESAPKLYAQYPLKTKTVGKLSKEQLGQLMEEFENAVFSTFKYNPLAKSSGCSNEAGLNEHKRTHINIQINRVSQMYASLYASCNPMPETDAAKFEYAAAAIEKFLKNVGALKTN